MLRPIAITLLLLIALAAAPGCSGHRQSPPGSAPPAIASQP